MPQGSRLPFAWVRVFAMVNVAPGFNQTPLVTNGYSGLILELYGPRGRNARPLLHNPDVWWFYYRCAGQWDDGPCEHKKMYRAGEMEGRVWRFVCSLLTNPAQLRADLDAMIEEERTAMRGDPSREMNAWLDKLAEADEERRGYQRLAAKGHMTDEEPADALSELDETRKTAERELEALRGRQERMEQMEQDRDVLLDE